MSKKNERQIRNHSHMVDVSEKKISKRKAIAEATVIFPKPVFKTLQQQDFVTHKGDIKQVGIIAGIMATKKTSDLLPMCHPLTISKCEVMINEIEQGLKIYCEVHYQGKTGVEMEALTGVSATALCIYDMCKSMSHEIMIQNIQLISKHGGTKNFNRYENE